MYKQETIFYPDTFQIHITKDYVDNILIEEKHFTLDNRIYYYINHQSNYMFKRFFFHNEELSKKFDKYYYILEFYSKNLFLVLKTFFLLIHD